MNGPPMLFAAQCAARRRRAANTGLIGLPAVLAAAVLALRLGGGAALAVVALLALAALAWAALRRAGQLNQDWLTAQLDAQVSGLEDSSALLFRDTVGLRGLAALQRDRLESRIAAARPIRLHEPWAWRPILGAWAVGAMLAFVIIAWPTPERREGPSVVGGAGAARFGPPEISKARLRIVPPAYTGLPPREQTALDVRAPEGSRIEWRIDFAPSPERAALAFAGGGAVNLTGDDGQWTGSRLLDRSLLYRIEAPGLARQRLHRLDAVADALPVVRMVDPATQLVIVRPGQRTFAPVFEAIDDHGVQASASLKITVTKGEGENVTVEERTLALSGRGEARRKRFSIPLDLAREGLAPGGDLIVQLTVRDNRAPAAQAVEGPSVILRWPSDAELADGLDGLLTPTMPAYFRSQRQIIIDAEALIAQRRRIAPDRFLDRSNALGIDQAALRARYGQFMGQEVEGGGISLPTNDAPAPPTNDAPEAAEPHHADDGHDHGPESAEDEPAAFGSAVDAVREYGHAHDDGDAATLFDPGTRSTLTLALDAMWGSERALRQGRPEDALPFAYRALELLKEAQQATRIYLGRTGSNLPPIDLSRRLTGEREDIVAEAASPPMRTAADAVAADAWRALAEQPDAPPLRLDALDGWVRGARGRLADPLGLTAAIDTVRNEPRCLDCRRRLRALLWTALNTPPAAVRRRPAPGTRGQRYLDALR